MLKIGYVPEHFSAPLLRLAASEWGKANITLVSQPSGTGQMLTSLLKPKDDPDAERAIDVAVALTEGLIAGIAKGRRDYQLVGSYVRSSLNWAVITGTDKAADKYQSIADLRGGTIGISRVGSGSQIMASVMAMQQGWVNAQGEPESLTFKVNDTFANLRAGVNQVPSAPELASAAFMWEWFTTKPYVLSGEVRFIGAVPTPWPSWTIAASTEVTRDDANKAAELATFLTKLQDEMTAFATPERVQSGEAASYIQDTFHYEREDVETWLDSVRWVGDRRPNVLPSSSTSGKEKKVGEWVAPTPPSVGQTTTSRTVSKATILLVLDTLVKAGVLDKPRVDGGAGAGAGSGSGAEAGWDLSVFVPDESVLVE